MLVTIAMLTAVAIFLRSMFVTCMSYTAGMKIHAQMLQHVLNAPINLFYDVTPTGLIINRFSKDLESTEYIYMNIMWVHACFYGLVKVVVVILLANWYMVIIFPFVGYYLIKIYRFTIKSYCEMTRLSSVSKSPILSHLSESIAGNSTIRAFKHQHHFLQLNNSDINKQIIAQQMSVGTQVWYSTQMNNISLLLMLFASIFCIIFRHSMSPVLLAMVFYQMLGLHGTMIGLLHTLANLEKKMVSV